MDWNHRVPSILFACNATLRPITGDSPFNLLYESDPNFQSNLIRGQEVQLDQANIDDCESKPLGGLQARKKTYSATNRLHDRHKFFFNERGNNASDNIFKRCVSLFLYTEKRNKTNPSEELYRSLASFEYFRGFS